MPNYSFSRLSHRINIDNDDFFFFFPFLKGMQLTDYIDSSDVEKLFLNEVGLYHELTHYYQDLFFPACNCESQLLQGIILNRNNADVFAKKRKLYKYLFEDGYCDENLYSLSGKSVDISISYTDLLESYADIRATKNFLDLYYRKNERVDTFIRKYIRENNAFHYEIYDHQLIAHITGRISRQYAICKHVFLSLFSITKSRFFAIDEYDTFNKVKLDLADALSYEKDKRFYNLERNLDIYLLFCMEFALTLPSASFIEKSIEEGKDIRMFHPGSRFYALIALIHKYPDTFNNLEFDANYVDVFNQISEICGLYSFEDVVRSLEKPYLPFSTISFARNRYLRQTKNNNIGNRCNIEILNFFKQIGVPILLWGNKQQQIYIGDGKDKFNSYQYEDSVLTYIYNYICSDMDRLSFGCHKDLSDLKNKINHFFLQESASAFVLSKFAESILNSDKSVMCPSNCMNKGMNCLLQKDLGIENAPSCVIPDLIKTLY